MHFDQNIILIAIAVSFTIALPNAKARKPPFTADSNGLVGVEGFNNGSVYLALSCNAGVYRCTIDGCEVDSPRTAPLSTGRSP